MPTPPNPQPDHDPNRSPMGRAGDNWALASSIALGSVIVGVFVPIFLLGSLIGVLWLVWIIINTKKHAAHLLVLLSGQRRSHDEAIDAGAFVRSVIDSADIPILATDEHGQIVHINRRTQEILGIGQSMIGRRFDEIMPQHALHELEERARGHQPGHAKLSLPIAGEMRQFDVSADPVEHFQGSVLTFRDITELSLAMTLKADFAANASHELRTPIASIKAAAETLTGPAKNDERMSDRLIEMISNNAVRLELLTSDLLDLSRLEAEDQPAQIEQVVLCELIEKVLSGFASPAEQRELTLTPEIEHGLDELMTDPTLLELILRNLVSNAIKFAHQGTSVRVVVTRVSVPADRTAPIPAGLDLAMGIVIEVIDQGIGIPLPHQQRIFERFYQVDEARTGSGAKRGTGLGLAIVKHAAKRLGGRVSLESVYQQGTTICIELPRCVDTGHDQAHPD